MEDNTNYLIVNKKQMKNILLANGFTHILGGEFPKEWEIGGQKYIVVSSIPIDIEFNYNHCLLVARRYVTGLFKK